MAITSKATLAAAKTQVCYFALQSATLSSGYLGNITSAVAGPTGAFATPTAFGSGGDIPTNNTAGALVAFSNAVSGNKQYLGSISLSSPGQSAQNIMLWDRVYEVSGFDGTVLTAQTVVSMPALTRPGSTGVGVMMMLELYATGGATPQNVTVSYTNSANTAGRTSIATNIPASRVKGTLIPLPLQAGDLGVKSIQSLTFGGSTGSVGNYGLTLAVPLAVVGTGTQSEIKTTDAIEMCMPTVQDGACLMIGSMSTSTALHGYIELIQG